MSVIIFIVILAVLVFVHELGHFLAAKVSGIRVDEFGLGFPPRLLGIKKGETEYTLNAIPFGGFVKIFGENPDESSISGPDSGRSFVHKHKLLQIFVLAAGVIGNIIFAWAVLSIGFMIGLPGAASEYSSENISDVRTIITEVAPQSPAEEAGLKPGDAILSLAAGKDSLQNITTLEVQSFIAAHGNTPITVSYSRGSEVREAAVTPEEGIVEGRPAVGIAMDSIGTVRFGFFTALYKGAELTIFLLERIAVGLFEFLKTAVTGGGGFNQVAGPVGIAGMVKDAQTLGFAYLLSFIALISLNLAIINLIPFPALDGGRILFVLVEAVTRRPIKPAIANAANAVGFAFLILLMIAVTYHDIIKLFTK